MKYSSKFAAMFGLDARIALAIFGALSVITGAALYSAIGNAKATSLLAQINEIGKAWESYYLDTGSNLPKESNTQSTSFYVLKTSELASNISNANGWNGPYLSYKVATNYLAMPKYVAVRLLTLTDSTTWGSSTHWANVDEAKCPKGEKCYLWVNILGIEENDPIIALLDKQIDNSDGGDSGNFKWFGPLGAWKTRLYFKYTAIKNPND